MLLTRDDRHMLTAEELRLRIQKRRRLVVLLALALLLGVTGLLVARPTRNAIKGWQARRHAAKAFALIERGNWAEARTEAVAAYQLRQSEPQALRAVARFLSRTGLHQAFDFWDQLVQLQSLNHDDLRDEAALALVSAEPARAEKAIAQLLSDQTQATPRDWLLSAQLFVQQGAPEKVQHSLGKIFANPAATAREQFQGTLLQLQAAHSGNAEVDSRNQAEAWQRLNQFALGNDVVASDSLVILAQRQLAGGATAVSSLAPEELVRRLESHPLAKAPQKLLAVDLQIQAKPDEREALVRQAIARWKNAEPSDLAALAAWLNSKGEYQRELDEIPEEKAVGVRDLFLQRMDALGALGRWDDIRHLLETERFPLDPVQQHMYLARASAQLGNPAAAKNNWQRALEAANGEVGKLLMLAEYAEKNGAGEIAESAYDSALVSSSQLRPAWQGKLRTSYARRDTRAVHAVLAEMLKLWPNDTAIQNDEAYTRLLLLLPNGGPGAGPSPSSDATAGVPPVEQLIEIEHLAEELVRREPASLPHRTVLALVRLKQQRPVAALQVYDGIQVVPNALTPSALAVHAAVLAANDQRAAAREEIGHAPVDKLLPEEQEGTADLRQ